MKKSKKSPAEITSIPEFDEDMIDAALYDIQRINRDAMNLIGLLTNDWSPERIKREEDNLFLAVRRQANEVQSRETFTNGLLGEELSRSTMLAPTVQDQETDCPPQPVSALFTTKEPSVQGKTSPAK